MNKFDATFSFETSAGEWSQQSVSNRQHLLLINEDSLTTTSAFSELTLSENEYFTTSGQTKSIENPSNLILKLRKISGLTWEQLAKLFNTTRRSLHYWSNGNSMTDENYYKLINILAAIESCDTGTPRQNRRFLLTPIEGCIPFNLLEQERFDDFDQIKNYFNSNHIKPKLSTAEIQARTPQPLDVLVNAKSERIHTEKRSKRKAKSKKIKKA